MPDGFGIWLDGLVATGLCHLPSAPSGDLITAERAYKVYCSCVARRSGCPVIQTLNLEELAQRGCGGDVVAIWLILFQLAAAYMAMGKH